MFRNRRREVALALASVVSVLGIAEVAVRLLRETPVRDHDALEFRRLLGARTPRVPIAVVGERAYWEEPLSDDVFAAGVTRILFLGDSFTYGSGLADVGDRFTDRVEASLNAPLGRARPPGRRHVFNAGIPGSEPVRWQGALEALRPVYRPHIVVAVFFLRDGTQLPTSFLFNEEMIAPIAARWTAMPLYHHSSLLRFFYNRASVGEYSRVLVAKLRAAYLGTASERAFWGLQQAALRDIASTCDAAGIAMHLVLFPLLFDLEDYEMHDVEAEIVRFAREAQIPTFSLTPGFLGRDARSLWVSPVDQHPNAEGHRIAAETLLPYVRAALAGVEPAAERASGEATPTLRR